MAKIKKAYFCKNCGYESPKWMGKCGSCGEWNTFQEELVSKSVEKVAKKNWKPDEGKSKPILIDDIQSGNTLRIDTNDDEFNRVLGGGLVGGSIILIGGQPGIGKSTLMLQLALNLPMKVIYVSGEESEEQIKMRGDRLNLNTNKSCYIFTETNISNILSTAKSEEPNLLIVDSIQTVSSPFLESPAGSISQIKECTSEFQRFAKETGIPVIIIGHITKDGGIAGPKVLEHIVDVVLQFEGDQNYFYRILRSLKNRFGSTDELGIYSMDAKGLKQISNPSEVLISQNDDDLSGTAIAASIEGARTLLIETQALVTPSVYGTPQRSATGFDNRRLSMILAVLEKRCGLPFGSRDVFLNIAGGIKVSDPAIDLAIVASLISSLQDISISPKVCFASEIGLTGEIRAIARVEQRIQEAERLGFEYIYISKYNLKGLSTEKFGIEIRPLGKLEDLLEEVFG